MELRRFGGRKYARAAVWCRRFDGRTLMRLYAVLAAVTLGTSLVSGHAARAQELAASSMDVLREQLDLDKKAVVEANLILTEPQAAAFWPIYEEHQRELAAIDAQVVKLVNDYVDKYVSGSITDAIARRMIGEATALDEAEVALRKRTLAKLDGAVPAIEAARYLQIENKIRAVVKFDLADAIPLVE
jgi:hypothetical protein